MRILSIFCLVVLLGGCATAMPNFYNGRYYMAGDSSCKKIYALSETRIMCVNSKGEETGYRDALTDQQLEMYRHNENMSQQQQQSNKPVTCYTNYGVTTCY